MRSNFARFPEIVFIDGTYKLFKAGLTLMLIVIQDNGGRTKFAGVGILVNETRAVVEWFLTCFKNSNKNECTKIKGFMTDKDLLERDVLREIFPGVPLFICQFHVLKVFSREINCQKLSITNDERIAALKILDKMVKSDCETMYNKWHDEFVKVAPKPVQEYFDKNWSPIKTEWTKYNVFHGNCGNLTNNRLESINSKIKGFLSRFNSLISFIKDFFKWHTYRNLEISYKDIQFKLRRQVHHTDDELTSINKCYEERFIDYAYKKVAKHLRNSEYVTLRTRNDQYKECTIRYLEETIYVTPQSCSCFEFWSIMIPCEHIFAVRRHYEMPLFSEDLCNERWKKDVSTCTTLPNSESPITNQIHCTSIKRLKTLSIGQKRQQLQIITNEIISVVSEQSNAKFKEKEDFLKRLLELWKLNKEVLLSTSICTETVQKQELEDVNTINDSLQSMMLNNDKVDENQENITQIINPTTIKRIGRVKGSSLCTLQTNKMKKKNKKTNK